MAVIEISVEDRDMTGGATAEAGKAGADEEGEGEGIEVMRPIALWTLVGDVAAVLADTTTGVGRTLVRHDSRDDGENVGILYKFKL